MFLPEADTRQGLQWLIKLRWIACGSLAAVITFAEYGLGFRLAVPQLAAGNLALAVLNLAYTAVCRRIPFESPGPRSRRWTVALIRLQIALDLTLLAYLLYFSGGFENPFVLFFVFHVVIASILLSKRDAFAAATFSIVLLGLAAAGEHFALLPHHHLRGLHPQELYFSDSYYLPATFFGLAATLYIVVYMSTSVVSRLRRRDAELEAANEGLKDKDRAKSQYVRTVSHDIRGSLAAIQGCLAVVLQGMTGPISEKPTAMVERAERRSRALLRFVDELLWLSTIRADGPTIWKPVDLVKTINQVVTRFEPALRDKELELTVRSSAGEAFVCGDPAWFDRLLTSLLENSVRYTPRKGRLSVVVDEQRDGGEIRVSVVDSGVGVPAADLPRIFEDFYVGSNVKAIAPEGTGLGLPIAREIAEAYGGSIRAESTEGRGSSFSFTLSTHPCPSPAGRSDSRAGLSRRARGASV